MFSYWFIEFLRLNECPQHEQLSCTTSSFVLRKTKSVMPPFRWRPAALVLCLFIAMIAAQTSSNQTNFCGSCSYPQAGYYGGWWTTAQSTYTTSIEAVTVVVVTNNDDTTSTSTIYNFPSDAPVPLTDSAGYPVFTKTLTYASSTITTALTWPTGYVAYQSGVSWTGAIPLAISSSIPNAVQNTCLIATGGSYSTYNTILSPIFPTLAPRASASTSSIAFNANKWYGWHFYDDSEADASCFDIYDDSAFPDYASLLPDFPVYKYCAAPSTSACAPVALQSVAFLTVTSHHSGPGPWFPSKPAHDTASTRSPATAESLVTTQDFSEPSATLANTGKPGIATITGAPSTSRIHFTSPAITSSDSNSASASQSSQATATDCEATSTPGSVCTLVSTSQATSLMQMLAFVFNILLGWISWSIGMSLLFCAG